MKYKAYLQKFKNIFKKKETIFSDLDARMFTVERLVCDMLGASDEFMKHNNKTLQKLVKDSPSKVAYKAFQNRVHKKFSVLHNDILSFDVAINELKTPIDKLASILDDIEGFKNNILKSSSATHDRVLQQFNKEVSIQLKKMDDKIKEFNNLPAKEAIIKDIDDNLNAFTVQLLSKFNEGLTKMQEKLVRIVGIESEMKSYYAKIGELEKSLLHKINNEVHEK